MSAGRSIVLCVALGSLVLGCNGSLRQSDKSSNATITKQPVAFASRAFDPASPPADMPPLATGEEAECDSNFLSGANVGGQTRKTDATHAFVTVRRIDMILQLKVTIWVPAAATPHVIEHEEGHRRIAEHYYETADQLAQRIADEYMGQVVEINGPDLDAESNKILQQIATEITDKYNKELNPQPAQLLYDSITDHGRNEALVNDAVAAAIKNVATQSIHPATSAGN
jgi:hypothetical protein